MSNRAEARKSEGGTAIPRGYVCTVGRDSQGGTRLSEVRGDGTEREEG